MPWAILNAILVLSGSLCSIRSRKIMVLIGNTYAFLKHVLFQYQGTLAQCRFRVFFLATLFLLGIGHLVYFFNVGNLALVAYDWAKEDAYLNALREAQIKGIIPWLWSEPFYHGTQRFLANPEIIMTPDILLLRWTSNNLFIIIHVLILYSFGFGGCLQIAKRQNTSLMAFFVFWLVFNFNGYLIAHLAVGHLQWAGYYLLPSFFTILSNFMTDSKNKTYGVTNSALRMSLLLGVLFFNGSFHIAIWCAMFMAIALLWNWTLVLNVVVSILFGGLIGFGRLLPAALWFPEKSSFISGYPTFCTLIDAITSIRGHDFGGGSGIFGFLGWWEYDIHIGFIAFVILLISFAVGIKRGKETSQTPIFAAAGVMLLLSLGDVYALIASSCLPFSCTERVSSRFIVMPFIVFLITAMKGLDELFCSWPTNSKLAVLLGLPFIISELVIHSIYWRISRLEVSFQGTSKLALSLVPNSDHIYAFSVYVGFSISLISLLVVFALLFRNRKLVTQRNS